MNVTLDPQGEVSREEITEVRRRAYLNCARLHEESIEYNGQGGEQYHSNGENTR